MSDVPTPVPASKRPSPVPVFGLEPPPDSQSPGTWSRRLAVFLDRPGQWGHFEYKGPDTAQRHAYTLTNRKVRVPEGEWEFTSRRNAAENKSTLWVRYLGAVKPAPAKPAEEPGMVPGDSGG